jgi:hypothetical protein
MKWKMNKLIGLFICMTVYSNLFGIPMPKLEFEKYIAAKNDSDKGRCLNAYLSTYLFDSTYSNKIKMLFDYYVSQKDLVGQDYVQLHTSRQGVLNGDYISVLRLSLQILERFEQRKDEYGLYSAYTQISEAFLYSKDFEQARVYNQKSLLLGYV